ncbi:apelin receptor B-like [Hippocampus comes]|nr:PREDICTED: apelin receptor B-like [Hippocampus comes]
MEPTKNLHTYYDYKQMENTSMCDNAQMATPLFIPVFIMLIFLLGLSGNSMVIFTVWRAEGKRRAVEVYIGNLALADLTFMVTLPLWVVYTAMDDHWPFGAALCKIVSYIDILNMYASVFLLTCMSFNRYQAIVHSLSSTKLRIRGHTRISLAAVWILSGLLAVPALIFHTTWHVPSNNHTSCTLDFGLVVTNQRQGSLWITALTMSLSTLGFLLPFLAMIVCYGLIGCTVMRHFNIRRQEDQRKWRLLKIITTVVVVFTSCWIPFHVLNSAGALSYLGLFPATCAFQRFLLLAYPYATCLAFINSSINPFLYAFLDLRLRSRCLCLLHLKKFRQTSTNDE